MKKLCIIMFIFILSCALAACGGDSGTGRTGGTGGASGGIGSGGSAQTQTNEATPTPTPDDSSDAAASTPEPAPPSASAAVGDIMKFGGYEWRVLEVSGGKALIITDKNIDFRAYHDEKEDITWADCELRSYLNGEFYESFDEADRAKIADANNANEDNQWYDTPGGADTTDKIFLLSLEEAVKYFGDSGQLADRPFDTSYQRPTNRINDQYNDKRITYAAVDSLWGTSAGSASEWWLRSPGLNGMFVAFVSPFGDICVDGLTVEYFYGVRPALWLNLE